jgi:UDP-N-acetylmuramate--alanine ligase
MTSHSTITNASHIHIIGIGGAGMSPLARILLQQGKTVSGSDQQPSPVIESLRSLGAIIRDGHLARNVEGADLVVASAAVRPDNPELAAAAQQGIPVIKGAVLLGELMVGRMAICVAGTHGKTTTTAMIAKILRDAGKDPSYVVGGEPLDLPSSGYHGLGCIRLSA